MHTTKQYLLVSFFITFAGISAMQEMPPQDPLSRINYHDAFDQTKIFEQFHPLMERWGCAANVFGETQATGTTPSEPSRYTKQEAQKHEEVLFVQACLQQLQSARRWTITEPAREALTFILLDAIAAGILVKTLKSDSTGGGLGVFAALFNSVYLLHNTVRAFYTLAYPPVHPLSALEELFAKNQCFIPRALWPTIVEKFMLARLNQFEQRTGMQYLEFALGLTAYKPKPAVRLKNGINLEECTQTLFERIDAFFDDYANPDNNKTYLWMLKHNVYTFVKSLQDNVNQSEAPRYLYLYGPGGIGKTYFIHQLCSWIHELMPNSIHFEEITVTSADELEGSQERPGAFLRIFRNQLMANKRGSVVFIDEATWLNDGGMTSPAKRVFNGDQSKISTTYFGSGVDGTGVSIDVPPMLIFVACNEPIKDIPLRSRFDTIHFPMPELRALVRHARAVCSQSTLLQQLHIWLDESTIERWITENKIDNFRDVAAHVVTFALTKKE